LVRVQGRSSARTWTDQCVLYNSIRFQDLLLEKLHDNYDLSRVRAIGGSAQAALVWWRSPALPKFSVEHALAQHLTSTHFSLPHTPTALDAAAHTHALALEAALGGPDRMAGRVGTCAFPSLPAAQLLRVREQRPDVWAITSRIQTAASFLASLITGQFVDMTEAEACSTGMWVHVPPGTGTGAAAQPTTTGHWDEGVLDIVGGAREEGKKVREWLGNVDAVLGGRRVGTVSQYLAFRYGFDSGKASHIYIYHLKCMFSDILFHRNDCYVLHG
jgi:xylulokinase